MRSDQAWRELLGRQWAALQHESDSLLECRHLGSGVEEARADFVQALQSYRATLEVAPLRVVSWIAYETSNPYRNGPDVI